MITKGGFSSTNTVYMHMVMGLYIRDYSCMARLLFGAITRPALKVVASQPICHSFISCEY